MPIFVESFDSYNGLGVVGGLLNRWADTGSSISSSGRQRFDAGRFGTGQALNYASGNGGSTHQSHCLLQDANGSFFAVGGGFALHAALQVSAGMLATSTDEKGFVLINSAGVAQLGLRFLGGSWQVVRWAAGPGSPPVAVLATSSPAYNDTNWRSFQFKGVVDSSAGSFELIIDGVETLSASGVNTGTGTIDRIGMITGNTGSTSAGAGMVIDDLVVKDSDAAHLPQLRIDGLLTNSDGAHLDLVPSTGSSHSGVVDESTVSTADYLSGSVVGEYDLLGTSDMAVAPAEILGVNVVGWADKTDVTTRAWNAGLKSGGTTSNGPDLTLATGVGYYSRMVEADPATAAAWLKSGVDAMELQPRIAV